MGGGQATSHGGKLLETVIRSMKLRRFEVCSYGEWKTTHAKFGGWPGDSEERLLIKDFQYTTIFGTPGRREYYIASPEWSGQLECKFQNSGGSVDEKIVYLTESLRRTDIGGLVIVFGGHYWSHESRGQAIVRWVTKEAGVIFRTTGKSLLVFDVDEFLDWVGGTFR